MNKPATKPNQPESNTFGLIYDSKDEDKLKSILSEGVDKAKKIMELKKQIHAMNTELQGLLDNSESEDLDEGLGQLLDTIAFEDDPHTYDEAFGLIDEIQKETNEAIHESFLTKHHELIDLIQELVDDEAELKCTRDNYVFKFNPDKHLDLWNGYIQCPGCGRKYDPQSDEDMIIESSWEEVKKDKPNLLLILGY